MTTFSEYCAAFDAKLAPGETDPDILPAYSIVSPDRLFDAYRASGRVIDMPWGGKTRDGAFVIFRNGWIARQHGNMIPACHERSIHDDA